ncbi:hypothetical protein PPACK8108_LOCUS6836 [Phakopsora pachyrhizi]|uniref:Uncharacterized protein n=1 Tax=Phakopsora pachyrhizi TaxID=170000 RepID=A0AAV0ARQ8_PHAPC|nr:hypothetical protein PPACK8108_LOCUS6836 [Phakopsora pachyrhizi]
MDDSDASWSSEYSDSLKNNISDAFSEPSTEGKSEECFNQESGISNHRFSSSWFPFKKKEIMIGCLISGCTRSLMSRKVYNHIRQVLRLCDVDLPSWKTVQSAKSQLLKKTHCKEKMSVIIMGNPITTVSIQGLLTQVCKLNVFVLSSSELQISISGDLDFYASDLKEIMAQDFLKP